MSDEWKTRDLSQVVKNDHEGPAVVPFGCVVPEHWVEGVDYVVRPQKPQAKPPEPL